MNPEQQLKLFRMQKNQILQEAIIALQTLREEAQRKLLEAVDQDQKAKLSKLITELGEEVKLISERVRLGMLPGLVK